MYDEDNLSGELEGEEIQKPNSPVTLEPPVPDVELIVDGFGFMPRVEGADDLKGSKASSLSSSNINVVRRYTWKTKNRMVVQVITYGATITSVQVPDRKGVPDDVVAGFDNLEGYMGENNPYFGATIGRYANYIRNGTMTLKPGGKVHMLAVNRGDHHYNGGFRGFDKVNWRSHVVGNKVIMSHVSESFDQGFPGTIIVQITFDVSCENTIMIDMKCTTTEPTAINLSNCLFFNLGGHHAGKEEVFDHIITINADKYTPVDDDTGMVTGEKKVVGGSVYDFRIPRMLRAMIPKMPFGGYDINYCVTQGTEQDVTFQARALHARSGRVLEVYSNKPGIQFYTGNRLPDPDKIYEDLAEGELSAPSDDSSVESAYTKDETSAEGGEHEGNEEEEVEDDERQGQRRVGYVPLLGKNGVAYVKHGLFCVKPQNYPDAVNQKNFPSAILNPGEVYSHKIRYKFGFLLGKYI